MASSKADAEPPEANEVEGAGNGPTIGERLEAEDYADFRRELEALPHHEAFVALVQRYGAEHGYRTVGRWIVGRGPKVKGQG